MHAHILLALYNLYRVLEINHPVVKTTERKLTISYSPQRQQKRGEHAIHITIKNFSAVKNFLRISKFISQSLFDEF